ncbi:MAG: hypothetical protein ABIG44_16075 [Planctomycetota bacterium]
MARTTAGPPISMVLLLLVLSLGAFASLTDGAEVYLDADHQGRGNKGEMFCPVDALRVPAGFVLTARYADHWSTSRDRAAEYQVGTVYIGDGAGVQSLDGRGSGFISGNGQYQYEELVITFDQPMPLAEIELGLGDVRFGNGRGNGDKPVIFLSGANDPGIYEYSILDSEIKDSFTALGTHEGLVNFAKFSTPPVDLLVDSFVVRETSQHITVKSFIPESPTLLLIVGGLVGAFWRR